MISSKDKTKKRQDRPFSCKHLLLRTLIILKSNLAHQPHSKLFIQRLTRSSLWRLKSSRRVQSDQTNQRSFLKKSWKRVMPITIMNTTFHERLRTLWSKTSCTHQQHLIHSSHKKQTELLLLLLQKKQRFSAFKKHLSSSKIHWTNMKSKVNICSDCYVAAVLIPLIVRVEPHWTQPTIPR